MRQEQACDLAQGLAGVNETKLCSLFDWSSSETVSRHRVNTSAICQCQMFLTSTMVNLGANCMTHSITDHSKRLPAFVAIKNNVHEQQFLLAKSNLSKFCHRDKLALANGLRLGLRWQKTLLMTRH